MLSSVVDMLASESTGTRVGAGNLSVGGRVVRDAVRVALNVTAARFSSDAPTIDARALQSRYGILDAWPADAQLGLCVLAWALGPGFSLKGFREALRPALPDFEGAARAVPIGADPEGIVLHEMARRCLENGSVVVRWDLNPEVLYWPMGLSSCVGAKLV